MEYYEVREKNDLVILFTEGWEGGLRGMECMYTHG